MTDFLAHAITTALVFYFVNGIPVHNSCLRSLRSETKTAGCITSNYMSLTVANVCALVNDEQQRLFFLLSERDG